MAGSPSSFVPAPVTPSKAKQRFTVDRANHALPLVSRIVRDIVACHASIAKQQQQTTKKLKATAAKPDANELPRLLERMQSYVDELTALGIELKDFESGLIDFVGRHKGHDVYLCWKLNEPRIEYWHEIEAGFAGRQPISTLDERE